MSELLVSHKDFYLPILGETVDRYSGRKPCLNLSLAAAVNTVGRNIDGSVRLETLRSWECAIYYQTPPEWVELMRGFDWGNRGEIVKTLGKAIFATYYDETSQREYGDILKLVQDIRESTPPELMTLFDLKRRRVAFLLAAFDPNFPQP